MLRITGMFITLTFLVACNSLTIKPNVSPNIIILRNFPPNATGYELYSCKDSPLRIAAIDNIRHDTYTWDQYKWLKDIVKSCAAQHIKETILTNNNIESLNINNKIVLIRDVTEIPWDYNVTLPLLSISDNGTLISLRAMQTLSHNLDDGSCRSRDKDFDFEECKNERKLFIGDFIDSVSISILKIGKVNYLRFWGVQQKKREPQTILISLPYILNFSRGQLYCVDNILLLLNKHELQQTINVNNLNKCRQLNLPAKI